MRTWNEEALKVERSIKPLRVGCTPHLLTVKAYKPMSPSYGKDDDAVVIDVTCGKSRYLPPAKHYPDVHTALVELGYRLDSAECPVSRRVYYGGKQMPRTKIFTYLRSNKFDS